MRVVFAGPVRELAAVIPCTFHRAGICLSK